MHREGAVPGDRDARVPQHGQLLGVVGEQPERRPHAEEPAGGGHLVVAPLVAPQAELRVGLEGRQAVAARLHEHAVTRLGGEARAAAFLREIEEHAAAGGGDGGERGVELLGAIAVAGAVDLAGDARRVHSSQQRGATGEIADGDRDRRLAGGQVVEAMGAEAAVHRVERPLVECQQRAVDGRSHRARLIGCLLDRASGSS